MIVKTAFVYLSMCLSMDPQLRGGHPNLKPL